MSGLKLLRPFLNVTIYCTAHEQSNLMKKEDLLFSLRFDHQQLFDQITFKICLKISFSKMRDLFTSQNEMKLKRALEIRSLDKII